MFIIYSFNFLLHFIYSSIYLFTHTCAYVLHMRVIVVRGQLSAFSFLQLALFHHVGSRCQLGL